MCHSLVRRSCAPLVPPTVRIQPRKARVIGICAEVVQVSIRGRDRLVTHPRLHRSDVNPTSQPQARGGVPKVMVKPTSA